MINKTCSENLLSDVDVQQFIRDGYLLVQCGAPTTLHQEVCRKLDESIEREGNIGNNFLPRVPEIQKVFDDPVVVGALTSLLGGDYTMNPHRHAHLNPAGAGGGGWHKDCYVWDHNLRHPRFHWVLALYYPHDVTEDMGPTAVLPGKQYYERISSDNPSQCEEEEMPLCGSAGTVALVHFDAWHRATSSTSEKKRYMLKFQFTRLREPSVPSWNHVAPDWTPVGEESEIWKDVWGWLCGNTGKNGAGRFSGKEEGMSAHLDVFRGGTEPERLQAAFQLSRFGGVSVPFLLDLLRLEAAELVDHVENKTPDNAHGTNPTACRAAQALVAVGVEAVPALMECLRDEQWLVRASVADVLGLIGPGASIACHALVACLRDEHWWVRRNAAEALGRIGVATDEIVSAVLNSLTDSDCRVRRMAALAFAQFRTPANGAVEALLKLLWDEDRYNRFYACLALRRMGDSKAQETLLDSLFASRWCPVTTSENLF